MKYYSTNKQAPDASLEEAVVKGLAADKGLFMPYSIKPLPQDFYDSIDTLSFQEIAYRVADAFFGEDVPAETLKQIVYDTLNFDVPLVKVTEDIYSLELFHGPTLAFKDVGGRFMARLLGYFIRKEGKKQVNVLVATSGDTGSAVANGFLGVEGIHVYVLYPKGKVSEIQEKQFTTLGQNITALEIDGTFDDCQALVKSAFMDKELNEHLQLTSANSINVARFLPQAFYYFYAYAQLKKIGKANNAVICVPSGNFGNITAGLFGKRMGLPVKRFIAANNVTISSINICKPEFILHVLLSLPLLMLWMWAIRVTSRVCSIFMEAVMRPFLLKSVVLLILMNRLLKRCVRRGRNVITCLIRMVPVVSVL